MNSRRRMTAHSKKSKRPTLPSGYQLLEYIQSSGTQYISLSVTVGYAGQNEMEIIGDSAVTSGSQYLTGHYRNSSGGGWSILEVKTATNSNGTHSISYTIKDNGSTSTTKSSMYSGFTKLSNKINMGTRIKWTNSYTAVIEYFDFDGNILKTETVASLGTTTGLWEDLFRYQSKTANGYSYTYGKCRIYNFRIARNGTTSKNLYSCYRISDGVNGMYDIVGNKFYTNSGTGTFARGPVVN